MELPALVERHLGDTVPETVLTLGDDDLAVFTSDELLLYRAESLLRDATLSQYPTTATSLGVKAGRRKTTVILGYATEQRQFTVRNSRADAVVEQLLGKMLRTTGSIDKDESVAGVYRFSDLTVVVTEARLLKQIGTNIWEGEYDEFRFEHVERVTFEQGQVATQVVLSVGGRSERIKVPSEEAPRLRQTLTEAVLSFHDADSLVEFNGRHKTESTGGSAVSAVALDESISPLIESESPTHQGQSESWQSVDAWDTSETGKPTGESVGQYTGSDESASGDDSTTDDSNVTAQLTTLAQTVERQQELLEHHAARIEELERDIERLSQD